MTKDSHKILVMACVILSSIQTALGNPVASAVYWLGAVWAWTSIK